MRKPAFRLPPFSVDPAIGAAIARSHELADAMRDLSAIAAETRQRCRILRDTIRNSVIDSRRMRAEWQLQRRTAHGSAISDDLADE